MALLERAREQESIPESHGIRLEGQPDATGTTAVRMTWAEQPETSDQVLDTDPVPVYVDAEIAPALEGTTIDVDEETSRFVMRRSPDAVA